MRPGAISQIRLADALDQNLMAKSLQNELSNWPATASAILINYANMPPRHWDFSSRVLKNALVTGSLIFVHQHAT